jgi:2-polyprenyl-3-methyl-5-hydroxy-6-metoxy-1,4-benzoquinol methylase
VSWIGEIGLRALIEFRQRASRNGTPPACPGSFEGYFRWQFDTSAALFRNYPGFDVSGKSVLEIGCGTGGRSAYLTHQGAARVVGIDINRQEVELARKLLRSEFPDLEGRVEYHVCPENAPLDIGPFDYVVLVDAMEHVVSPFRQRPSARPRRPGARPLANRGPPAQVTRSSSSDTPLHNNR